MPLGRRYVSEPLDRHVVVSVGHARNGDVCTNCSRTGCHTMPWLLDASATRISARVYAVGHTQCSAVLLM